MRAYTKGDRVSQPQYGTGTITDVTDRYTVIDFDQHGVRTFVTSLVTLEATDEPAPADRPRRAARKRTRKTAASN
jgi:hypothetical protein